MAPRVRCLVLGPVPPTPKSKLPTFSSPASASFWHASPTVELSVPCAATTPQRKPEGQTRPDLINRVAIRDRMSHCEIGGDVLVDLPDQTDQTGYGFEPSELLLVENLGDWSHRPFCGTLDDGAQKNVAMVLAGERCRCVQMDSTPIPALRDNQGRACSESRIPNAVGQKHPEFRGG